jgi:tetratricopeptide (TPR) repeat protein
MDMYSSVNRRSRKPLTQRSENASVKLSESRLHRLGRRVLWAKGHFNAEETYAQFDAEEDGMLRRKALSEAHRGNYDEAIALFNAVIVRNPDSANDYNNRGLVYYQSGQGERAIADYNKAIALNSRLGSAYNNRANYYAAQGQFLEALADYDAAIDVNPSNIRAWINQGITQRDLGRYDDALESFDLALCFSGFEGHIYAERGHTYHLRGDWNCAIADYARALDHLPDYTIQGYESISRLRAQVHRWMDELLKPIAG